MNNTCEESCEESLTRENKSEASIESPTRKKENNENDISPSKNWCVGPWVEAKQQLNSIYTKKLNSPTAIKRKQNSDFKRLLMPLSTNNQKCVKFANEKMTDITLVQIHKTADERMEIRKHKLPLIVHKEKSKSCLIQFSKSPKESLIDSINKVSILKYGRKYIDEDVHFPKIIPNSEFKVKIKQKLVKYKFGREESCSSLLEKFRRLI